MEPKSTKNGIGKNMKKDEKKNREKTQKNAQHKPVLANEREARYLFCLCLLNWISNIFCHRRQDHQNWSPEARFSIFSATSARISENEFQEVDFSIFSATGVRISETGLQKFDFQHFPPQAPGSAKLRSRSWIFSIFDHRRQDQRK